jgi:hypothetical protein
VSLVALASLVALGALLAPPLARVSYACSCMGTPPLVQAYQQAAAVFSGRVYSLERTLVEAPSPDPRTQIAPMVDGVHARFDVLEIWKGVTGRGVELWTGSGGGDCGFEFQFPQEYLIFAYRTQNGRLFTGVCSNTRELANAAPDRSALGAGMQPPPGPPPWEGVARGDAQPEGLPDPPTFEPWKAVLVAGALTPVSLAALWLVRGRGRRRAA